MSFDGKPVLFRKAFHGFDTDDVNNYITEMNLNFSEKENGYQEKIHDLSALVSVYQCRIVTLENEIRALRDAQPQPAAESSLPEVPSDSDTSETETVLPICEAAEITETVTSKTSEIETAGTPSDNPAENESDAVKIRENAEVLSKLMLERTKRSLLTVNNENQSKFNSLALEANNSFETLLMDLRVKLKDLQLSEDDTLEKIKTRIGQTIDELFPNN